MNKTMPRLLVEMAAAHPEANAQLSKNSSGDFVPTTYRTLLQEVRCFAAGLMELGIKRGDNVGLISDNRKEWLIADLSVLSLGAVDVPRGTDSMPQELSYILEFSGCVYCIVENEQQLAKIIALSAKTPELRHIVVLDPAFENGFEAGTIAIHRFSDIMKRGETAIAKNPTRTDTEIEAGSPDDTATIIFTSGTTGEPKGVMLSHRNFYFQVTQVGSKMNFQVNDIWLCVLPVWHVYERAMQYYSLGRGCTLAYSKPIGKIMLADFVAVKPTWMSSVPRIWELIRTGVINKVKSDGGIKYLLFRMFLGIGTAYAGLNDMVKGLVPAFKKRNKIADFSLAVLPWLLLLPLRLLGNALVFNKIKAKLGGRFKAGISGGGALPNNVDKFFAAAGILLLEGYGLTETGPVIAVRTQWAPVRGTVGSPLPNSYVEIRDENGNVLRPGQRGIIWVRGEQIMKGYYKRPLKTREIIDENGWLNTGDLGMLTFNGEVKIVGRAKDTIVLLGGENVEPAPMENRLRESPFIDNAVVIGQDQKIIAALIIPNQEMTEKFALEHHISFTDWKNLLLTDRIQVLFREQISAAVSAHNGFKAWERISKFVLLPKAFEVGKELSGKQEVKRHFVNDAYKKEIESIFS